LVFSRIFHADITAYAPYILSGVIVWECISGCVAGGALAFVQADAYIRQNKHPLAIYTLRTTLLYVILLALSSLALVSWTLIVKHENFGWSWISLIFFYPFIFFIMWPLSTILAFVGVRFRDLPHAIGLILQALWFISPVYFEEKLFRDGGLGILVDLNPIYHILELIRAPLLRGVWPSSFDYIFVLSTGILLTIIAWKLSINTEKKVIFYL